MSGNRAYDFFLPQKIVIKAKVLYIIKLRFLLFQELLFYLWLKTTNIILI